jgi:hypothetical protein
VARERVLDDVVDRCGVVAREVSSREIEGTSPK